MVHAWLSEAAPQLARLGLGGTDSVSKLLLALEVSERTLEMAQRVAPQVMPRLASGCVPLFLTKGFKAYGLALCSPISGSGCLHLASALTIQPCARWIPHPELLYTHVVKTYHYRRLVHMQQRVVFGALAHVTCVLAVQRWYLN